MAGRLFACVAALIVAIQLGTATARAEIVLTDAAGREVRLAAPATRIVTNESLLLLSLALIEADPVSRIAGWAAPRRLDAGILAAFRARFPSVDDIPVVGAVTPAEVSVESILAARPDLYLVSIWQEGWHDIAAQLEAAGVPVIFLDGPANADRSPDEAVAFSIELLGKAIGAEAKASEFGDFVRARFKKVVQRLQPISARPSVLIDAFAGLLCCSTPGRDNRLTQIMEMAGGHSIGAAMLPGYEGRLSAEFVLGSDPHLYVATGGPHLASQGGFVLGGGVDLEAARASLRSVVSRNLLDALTAVRTGRAYGISHQFAISSLSVVVFECMAKWAHPALFADIDPAATLEEINTRFMAIPLKGTFCVDLPAQ